MRIKQLEVDPAAGSEESPAPADEQPPVDLGIAVRRHPMVVIVSVLVLVSLAAAVGLLRSPVYTASARLVVGDINLDAPGAVSRYAAATQGLASAYSRAITASAVVQSVAREARVSTATVRSRLSATPIASSPVFLLSAKGPSSSQAIALANAASLALVKYVATLNRGHAQSSRLLAQLEAASRQLSLAKAAMVHPATTVHGTTKPTPAQQSALARATAAVRIATSSLAGIQRTYANSLAAQSSSKAQILSSASSATSDRRSKLEVLLFAGLVAGLIFGTVLATLRARREVVVR